MNAKPHLALHLAILQNWSSVVHTYQSVRVEFKCCKKMLQVMGWHIYVHKYVLEKRHVAIF